MHAPAPSPRVLILKLAAMGDCIMASTLIAAVRDRWPAAHLTWVTGDGLAPLVRRFDGVDRVIGVDADALLAGRGLRRIAAALRAAAAIGRGPYDLALVAHFDPRYRLLLRAARIRETRGAHDGAVARAPRPGHWHGEEYARLVLDESEVVAQRSVSPRLGCVTWPTGRPPQRPRRRDVLLAPGGARNVLRDNPLRRWPIEHWQALARALHAAGCHLTVIGARSDAAEAEAVLRAVPEAANAVGKDSLDGLLDRLASADAIVTHDSGTLHLAQLTDTPAVALFGPTPPASFVAPTARVTVVSAAAGLACAPCYDGRDYAPCALNRCLSDVPPARVTAAVESLLAEHGD